jgi:hypothetical protein
MFVLSNKIKYFVSQLPYRISIKDISPMNLSLIQIQTERTVTGSLEVFVFMGKGA